MKTQLDIFIKSIIYIIFTLLSISCGDKHTEVKYFISYVDTRVGTAASVTNNAGVFGKHTEEYGQTLPAVLEPNGMNFWTPQTQDTELKCISPYYYSDTLLQGFRNSHWIVGGCTQDYGSMTLMTVTDSLRCSPEKRATPFSHDDEIATPAYYSVELPEESVKAELTSRSRSAIFRFTYHNAGKAYILVNPNSDEGLGCISVDTVSKRIYGYNPVHRIYQRWGEYAGYDGHFVLEYQKEISEFGTFCNDSVFPESMSIANKKGIGIYIGFDVKQDEQVLVKIASSFVSHDGALKNLKSEIPYWDFDETRSQLTDIWEKHFATINVCSDDEASKRKFYGAFYRASFLPRTFSDVDGRYPSFAKGEPVMSLSCGNTYYDDFSVWDTYRALHPMLNIITPSKAGQMMNSLMLKYEQGGWLPVFPCWNSYTAAMIGDHCISLLCDAYIKGVEGFDICKAYEAMRQNAFVHPSEKEYLDGCGRRALSSYLKYGYIPLEDSVMEAFHTCEQVSRTLEYSYDDYVLSVVARKLGKSADADLLQKRAGNYRNVINPSTGYAQGRYLDGSFLNDDNAFRFTGFITEGAPCHYTWYVPHDVYGLMDIMGGKDAFVAKLDSMFSQNRYWHGNEPCHQIAFMYNYAGKPWKTADAVRYIMDTEYIDSPGGLSGNDDAGQMSAWYMFAAIGFYPVCPGSEYYILSAPTFSKVEFCLENGRTFVLNAPGVSDKNRYIKSVRLNGRNYSLNYISHKDIMSGGVMEFEMTDDPMTGWGTDIKDCPPNLMKK